MRRSFGLQGNALGITYALLAASFYGCVPNFARIAFDHGIPAMETVLLRTSVIAIVLGTTALARRESFLIPKVVWPSFLMQALATFLVSACYLASIQFIPVGLAVIIFFAFPIIIVLAAPLIEGRTLSLARLGVALLGFTGLAVAVGPGISDLDIRGVGLAAAAALGCALQFFSGRTLGHHVQPAVFASLVHLAIWPFILGTTILSEPNHLHLLQAGVAGIALLCVAGASLAYVGGYYFQMSSVKAAPASVVAPYFNLEPIVTTMISTAILGETLKLNQYGGGALVLAALALASQLGKRNDTA